jgi:hypothetical protein
VNSVPENAIPPLLGSPPLIFNVSPPSVTNADDDELTLIAWTEVLMIVLSVHVNGHPEQVVAPSRVTVLLMLTAEVHVQVPAGTETVSPVEAELIADWTADDEHDVAAIVAARTGATWLNTPSAMKRVRSASEEYAPVRFKDPLKFPVIASSTLHSSLIERS